MSENIITKDIVRQFTFGVKVRGAYVQQPERARLVGIEEDVSIFSVDAKSLYPSIMIFNNISEETLRARVYDSVIVSKALDILKKAIESDNATRNQIKAVFKDALYQQFHMFVQREKPQKMKETLEINSVYYSNIFNTLVDSGYTFEDICSPIDDRSYYLLKSFLHPLLEALTWTSPYNRGYNNTVTSYVFFPEQFENKIKNAWVLQDIYSTKSKLVFVDKRELTEKFFSNYILNPFGTLFETHKNRLANDVKFLKFALENRDAVKNEMIVLSQLYEEITSDNLYAKQLLEYLYNGDYTKIDSKLLEKSNLKKIMEAKRIDDLRRLSLVPRGSPEEALILSNFFRNLKQGAAKVFANTSYGIKGLLTFQFAAPVLGNSITTGGKIYGIKVAQYMAAKVLDEQKYAPSVA